MQDTSIEIQRIYHDLIMSKTGEERFLMGISMFQIAREFVLASFPQNISDKQKKKLLLERFYGFQTYPPVFSDNCQIRLSRQPLSSSQKRGEKSCNNKQTVLTSEVAMKKLKQFAMLYEMAWELKRAAFKKKYPQLENAEINKLTAKVFTMAKT
ncbi:MAG: hypothetical protein KAT74_07400 [Candidatus Cloacimonetes bacterium]|nr:hypothetical protein [Candidatus Cloacimonadota bacterium]